MIAWFYGCIVSSTRSLILCYCISSQMVGFIKIKYHSVLNVMYCAKRATDQLHIGWNLQSILKINQNGTWGDLLHPTRGTAVKLVSPYIAVTRFATPTDSYTCEAPRTRMKKKEKSQNQFPRLTEKRQRERARGRERERERNTGRQKTVKWKETRSPPPPPPPVSRAVEPEQRRWKMKIVEKLPQFQILFGVGFYGRC